MTTGTAAKPPSRLTRGSNIDRGRPQRSKGKRTVTLMFLVS